MSDQIVSLGIRSYIVEYLFYPDFFQVIAIPGKHVLTTPSYLKTSHQLLVKLLCPDTNTCKVRGLRGVCVGGGGSP